MDVSLRPLFITRRHLTAILPLVDRELLAWRRRAEAIPDPVLRHLALSSIDAKRFHCEGGSVFAAWEPRSAPEIVRFIVALQTISDYLDNLCDRTESGRADDFRTLHEAMIDAVSLDRPVAGEYYRLHPRSEDGGYLEALVATCRDTLRRFPRFSGVAEEVLRLVGLYNDLQVYKHVSSVDPLPGLKAWFARHRERYPFLHWWEFAAASGSTLGVFALIAEAARPRPREDQQRLLAAYFPWVCGLHILLDYFIDQEEDRRERDVNLVSFYPDKKTMAARIGWMLGGSIRETAGLRDAAFHRTVIEGLLGLYLTDPKVEEQGYTWAARSWIGQAGWRAGVFYRICRRWRQSVAGRQREAMTS